MNKLNQNSWRPIELNSVTRQTYPARFKAVVIGNFSSISYHTLLVLFNYDTNL